jgi:hypothetical protein
MLTKMKKDLGLTINMIYAEILHFTSEESMEEKSTFKLVFYGKDSEIMNREYDQELENLYEESKSSDSFHGAFGEFGKDSVISIILPLNFLAKRDFIPISKDFFYKK